MKQRNLLTNIFSVLLIVSLVAFLLVTFGVVKGVMGEAITFISLPIAIISVACIDIVFPILDNKQRLREDKVLRILTIVKIVIFIAAFVVMSLYVARVILNEVLAVIIFIILYFAQFFINIDPKQPKISVDEDLEDEEDEENADDVEAESDTYSEDKDK